jgi:hypothetical protein
LQKLLTDVWGEGEVVAAFDSLAPAPVPTLAQLLEQQQQQQQQVEVDAAEAPVDAAAAAGAGGSPVAGLLAEPALAAVAELVLDSALLDVLQEEACCGRQQGG